MSLSPLRNAYQKILLRGKRKRREYIASEVTTSGKPQYCYEALKENHIRVLKLFPGKSGTHVCCSLQVVNLLDFEDITATASTQHIQSYDALSYVWGDPKLNSKITCDGQTTYITASLHDALLRLRDLTEIRIFWADALCINQNDLNERAEQVKLMGLIYWKARHVHVWLGPDDGKDRLSKVENAIDLMRTLGKLWDDSSNVESSSYSLKLYGAESSVVNSKMRGDERLGWNAMRLLLNKPWFQRVWVVQELGLSRAATFYCGKKSFTRDELDCFLSFLESRGTTLIHLHELNLQMLQLANHYRSGTRGNMRIELGSDPEMAESFLDILGRARGLQCTDPRDSIYAFLGHPAAFKQHLLDGAPYLWYPRNFYNGKETIIQPNYDKTNTWTQLYIDLAIALIDKLKLGLQLLSHVAHDEETLKNKHPSWVPRWDLGSEHPLFFSQHIYYAASGNFQPTQLIVAPREPGFELTPQIRLSARCLGIVDISQSLPCSVAHILQLFAPQHRDKFLGWPGNSPDGDIPDDLVVFAMTLTAGLTTDVDLLVKPAEEHIERHLRGFWAYARRQEGQNGYFQRGQDEEADYYEEALQRAESRRSLFRLQTGNLGLGPRLLHGGDEIWLPMGARMPFIFRPLADGKFKILGQAYVHGVMRGEAVKGLSGNDFEIVTLC